MKLFLQNRLAAPRTAAAIVIAALGMGALASAASPMTLSFGYDAAGNLTKTSKTKSKEFVYLGNKLVAQNGTSNTGVGAAGCGFNVDAAGVSDATSDGLLITRFNRGFAGAALVAGARLDQTPANLPNTSANVSAHMDAYARAHDVDGNESVNLTDALIITRYLAGFRGTALTSGLTLSGTRTNSSAIEAYIAQDCPNAGTSASTETLSYLHPNVSGSPLMATDAFGSALWREDYLAFGEKTKYEASVNQNQNFFIGKPTDATTGLVYFGARWYDPAVARFLSFDPAEVDDANPHSFNRYSYGNNNPHKFLDPDGRAAIAAMGVMGRQAAAAQTLGSTTLSNPGAPQLDPSTGIMSNPGQSASAAYIGGFLSHVSAVATMFTPIHVMETLAGIITRTLKDPLPRDKNGNPVPESNLPHSQLGTEAGSKGSYQSAREFGKDGKPIRDIHFTDHGRAKSHPNPHQHTYEPNPTGGTPQRGPAEPIKTE